MKIVHWDEWRGSFDGIATMLIKRLLYVRGSRIDLHKMIRPDDAECFHTHPAYAIRIILKGGYLEEIILNRGAEYETRTYREWLPGDIGLIRPQFTHRLDMLPFGPSYSLWLRGPVCADVELVGDGWPEHVRGKCAERN